MKKQLGSESLISQLLVWIRLYTSDIGTAYFIVELVTTHFRGHAA